MHSWQHTCAGALTAPVSPELISKGESVASEDSFLEKAQVASSFQHIKGPALHGEPVFQAERKAPGLFLCRPSMAVSGCGTTHGVSSQGELHSDHHWRRTGKEESSRRKHKQHPRRDDGVMDKAHCLTGGCVQDMGGEMMPRLSSISDKFHGVLRAQSRSSHVMCLSNLPACMSIKHVCTWYPQRS